MWIKMWTRKQWKGSKSCVKKSIKRQSTIALISNFMITLSLGLWDIINIGMWYLSSRSFKQSEVQN